MPGSFGYAARTHCGLLLFSFLSCLSNRKNDSSCNNRVKCQKTIARGMNHASKCILSLALEPNRSFELGLNSESADIVQSATGAPLEPVVSRFKTRP